MNAKIEERVESIHPRWGKLGAVALARTLTRPIRDLKEATQTVAEGEYGQTVHVRSRDELGHLAQSFNAMSAELARMQSLRRQMTADIAHELRTPISVILGYADGLMDGVLPLSLEKIAPIRQETLRLEQLVDDLRVLSRADAGELSVNLAPVSPGAMLREAAQSQALMAEARGIELIVEDTAELPQAMADPDRAAQVLSNLVDNALLHAPRGSQILLAASLTSGMIQLQVTDQGPGIQPEDLPRIFDRFYRTDSSRRRDTGGSGLGLAIARSLAEAQGGKLWATSTPGQGASFHFSLPRADTPA